MSRVPKVKSSAGIPVGLYKSYEEVIEYIPGSPPEEAFDDSHLTYIGRLGPDTNADEKFITVRELNRTAAKYGIDAFVMLHDVGILQVNARFEVPAIAWYPCHYSRLHAPEAFELSAYAAIAALSPSSAKMIRKALAASPVDGDAAKAGGTPVSFVPHILDRAHTLGLIRKDIEQDTVPRSSMYARAHADTADGPTDETPPPFIVLMQGGNYDNSDRKGWDTSIQAFVRFYNRRLEKSSSPGLPEPRIQLYIHAINSYMVVEDEMGMAAPPELKPVGLPIRQMLRTALGPQRFNGALNEGSLGDDGRPLKELLGREFAPSDGDHRPFDGLVFVDGSIHSPGRVARLKADASVCLHASKTEGFGLNAMECQMLGTPVITTAFGAMRDFTKLGRSVAPRQTIHDHASMRELPLPDVAGIASALEDLYKDHCERPLEPSLTPRERRRTGS
jgi:glycosyltransferase involved in cell wall biosynthesis